MKKSIFTFLLLILISNTASAVLIVDTGPGPNGAFGFLALFQGQSIAAQFQTDQKYTLKSIEGWMSANAGTGTIAIYTNSMSNLPGSELFSIAFAVPNSPSADWEGVDNLGWMLEVGTYWVAFEVRAGQTLGGGMPFPAANPLAEYALNDGIDDPDDWSSTSNSVGVRIHATVIPIPAAAWLFGSALVGLIGWSRRQSHK